MKNIFFIMLFVFWGYSLFSQNVNLFKQYEDSLNIIGKKMIFERYDSLKYAANVKFTSIIKKALNEPKSFYYGFDSLKTAVHIYSSDKKVRIITWYIPKKDGTYKYFGIIQFADKKPNTVFDITDESDERISPFNDVFDAQKWYGAIYYEIIKIKSDGKRYYTLLGWKGNNKLTNKKVIDVLWFDDSGKPYFGKPIFVVEKNIFSRFIFEYSAEATLSLRYYKKIFIGKNINKEKSNLSYSAKEVASTKNRKTKNIIVFEHLAPAEPQMKRQFQFYVPDLSYDALILKKGKWNLITDIDARNPHDKNEEQKNKNREKPKMGLIQQGGY